MKIDLDIRITIDAPAALVEALTALAPRLPSFGVTAATTPTATAPPAQATITPRATTDIPTAGILATAAPKTIGGRTGIKRTASPPNGWITIQQAAEQYKRGRKTIMRAVADRHLDSQPYAGRRGRPTRIVRRDQLDGIYTSGA